jgi:OOP family OmpA-OmpF porin
MDDDNRNIGYKRSGGHRYNKNLALEGGYFNSGKFGFTATTVPAGVLSGNIELKGLNPDAVGIVSITEKFSAFGRVGLNCAEAKDFFTATGLAKTPSA